MWAFVCRHLFAGSGIIGIGGVMWQFREFIASKKWTEDHFALEMLLWIIAAGAVLIAFILFL